jgi:hypothetical protein
VSEAERSTTPRLAALLRGDAISFSAFALRPEELLAVCERERVTGLVHRRISTVTGEAWPADVCQLVADRVRAHAAAELLVREELAAVLDALAAESIHPIVIKGTGLAYSVYDSPALRPRFDTDLLVRHDQIDRVRTVLERVGYATPLHCGGELIFCQFPLRRRTSIGLEHRLDVHWKISTQSVFADVLTYEQAPAVPLPALSPHARTIAAVDALLLACIHPVMHHRNSAPLVWMYDVHLLAAGMRDHEFACVTERAIQKRVAAVCAHQLAVAQAVFHTPIPATVWRELRAADRHEPSGWYLKPDRQWLDEVAASIRGLPRWRDRVRLVREILFPAPSYVLQSYGYSPTPCCAPLLPALYAHRLAWGGWKALAGRK